MIQGIILGIIQGIAEWLPVSSEGLIALISANFFDANNIKEIIEGALLLHLGTFLSALIYFRKDVWSLIKIALKPKEAMGTQWQIFKFLLVTTIISGLLGWLLIRFVSGLTNDVSEFGKWITLLISALLFVTAFLQINSDSDGNRKADSLSGKDSFWLGIMQGLAALPGLSRSGLTIAGLLFRQFDKTWALKLSFLMSMPIILGGNIILNYNLAKFTAEMWWGLVFSFIFGLLTIHVLLKLAEKINFGYFVLLFALITLAAVFI